MPIWQLFLVTLPVSLSGGLPGLSTACNAYAADVSERSGAKRSIHLAMLHVSAQIGRTVGSSCGALLYRHVGAAGPFAAHLLCSLLNILYITLVVKESRTPIGVVSVGKRLRAVFDVDSIRRMARVMTRKRRGARRVLLHLYIAAFTCTVIITGESCWEICITLRGYLYAKTVA